MLQAYNETQKSIYESLLEGYTPSESATSEQTTGENPPNTTNTGGTSNPEVPVIAPAGEPPTRPQGDTDDGNPPPPSGDEIPQGNGPTIDPLPEPDPETPPQP